MKSLLAVLGGLLIACTLVVGAALALGPRKYEPSPELLQEREAARAESAVAAFRSLPRAQQTCSAARAAGASFAASSVAWKVWHGSVLKGCAQ